MLPTRGCASRRASAAENGAWAIVASGQGTKQRRAVGSDRNHPVPGPCGSRVGALVGEGAACSPRAQSGDWGNSPFGRAGHAQPVREELEGRGDVESFTTRTDSLGREQPCGSSGDPVERLHGARGVWKVLSRRAHVRLHSDVTRPDDRGDSARRQAAPAPDQSRSRTGRVWKTAATDRRG